MRFKIPLDSSTKSSQREGSRLIDESDVSDASIVGFYEKASKLEEIPGLISDLNEIFNENEDFHFLFKLRNNYYNIDDIDKVISKDKGNIHSISQILYLGEGKPLLILFENRQKVLLNPVQPASFVNEGFLVIIPKPPEVTGAIIFNIEEVSLKITQKMINYGLEPDKLKISLPMMLKLKKPGLEAFTSTEEPEKEVLGDMNYVSLIEYYKILKLVLARIQSKINAEELNSRSLDAIKHDEMFNKIKEKMNNHFFYKSIMYLESTGYIPRAIFQNIAGIHVKYAAATVKTLNDLDSLAQSISGDIIDKIMSVIARYPIGRPILFSSLAKYPSNVILEKDQAIKTDFVAVDYEKLDNTSKMLLDEAFKLKKGLLKSEKEESIKIGKIWRKYKIMNASTLFNKNEVASRFYDLYLSQHEPAFSMAITLYFFDIVNEVKKVSVHIKNSFPSQKWFVSTVYRTSEIPQGMKRLSPLKIKSKGEELFETDVMEVNLDLFNLRIIEGIGGYNHIIAFLKENLKNKKHYLIIGSNKTHKYEIADAIGRDVSSKNRATFDIFSQYVDYTWNNKSMIKRKTDGDSRIILIDNIGKISNMKEIIGELVNREDKIFVFMASETKPFLTPPESIFKVEAAKLVPSPWNDTGLFKNFAEIEKKYGKSTAAKIKQIWDADGTFAISLLFTKLKMFKLLEQKDILSFKNTAIILREDELE